MRMTCKGRLFQSVVFQVFRSDPHHLKNHNAWYQKNCHASSKGITYNRPPAVMITRETTGRGINTRQFPFGFPKWSSPVNRRSEKEGRPLQEHPTPFPPTSSIGLRPSCNIVGLGKSSRRATLFEPDLGLLQHSQAVVPKAAGLWPLGKEDGAWWAFYVSFTNSVVQSTEGLGGWQQFETSAVFIPNLIQNHVSRKSWSHSLRNSS